MPWTKLQADKFSKKDLDSGQIGKRTLTFRNAVLEAFRQSMEADPNIILLGEGIDDPGGVFGSTLDLHKEFGKRRVMDTALAENGITGIGIGAALTGLRPVIIHMRIDFLLLAMDQIVNHAAKWHYMLGGKVRVPITIRAIMGKGWGSGAQHSQSFYSIFTHFPGLKVILPASPYDAKGLLIASIKDNNPVIIIEHRWSYDQRGIVPEEPYSIPLGKADLAKTGKDVTVIVSSLLVAESMQAAQELESDNIDTEVINLRTIKPMDKETIFNSVKKTGKAVIVDMGNPVCGIASEISALLVQNVFEYLKAPVKVITLPDTPVPSCHVLEQAYFPNKEKIKDIIKSLM